MRVLVATLFVMIAAAGCAPADAEIRRERLAAERRNLEATFDRLEERMMATQARVRFWQEMKARHESVTAVACAVQETHAVEMVRRMLPAEPRRVSARRAERDTTRVASIRPASTEPAAEPAPTGAPR